MAGASRAKTRFALLPGHDEKRFETREAALLTMRD
jgi:hypothetical protein